MKKAIKTIEEFMLKVNLDHTGAYAAQSAFFIVLSLIPSTLLLLTLVQFTPVTKADVMTAVYRVIPKTFNSLIISIVNQVYNQSRAVIPLTAIMAVWSAGRGVLAISSGLNCVYNSVETRNYVFIRIRAGLYTLLFLASIVLSLVLLVFGNSLSILVNQHAPFMNHLMILLIRIRTILSAVVLTLVSMLVYKFLPNRKGKFRRQLPGAVFTAIGWLVASFIFSVYVDIFKGFANMYGSLTTIVLIMLWLYFCMYIMLLGGQINMWVDLHFHPEDFEVVGRHI
ncbi:YihY/virulence factor BrkB family protein [Lachnospiraceae bacterium LCP25S3_G4]